MLSKDINQSRYERLIFNLAEAYDGYQFYLPAFLDFRGRIYRSGILHFHERDLARSLILFADCETSDNKEVTYQRFYESMAFHYKSFVSDNDALQWSMEYTADLIKDDDNLNIMQIIQDGLVAKRPFQFIANVTGLLTASFNQNMNILSTFPITQDASASAYQIMSYFMLDESLAMKTNLIPSDKDEIQDVSSFFLTELKVFMQAELEDKNLSKVVCNILNRKIVKGIFMPLIYGKTLMSTASDLREHLGHDLTHKECFVVASACFKFWNTQYPNMACLIKLIRNIGWVASASDRPVFYKIPYFCTVQDYMKMDTVSVSVYDRSQKKRRRLTLRISSSKRDRRKTEIATFVNFIHQNDAKIAMRLVESMLNSKMPIYTVHDNFITTAQYCHHIPKRYSDIFSNMGPPLSIINKFLYMNVIYPTSKMDPGIREEFMNKINCAIPQNLLSTILQSNIPDNITKRGRDTWNEKNQGIIDTYNKYTSIVCANLNEKTPQNEKWEKFRLKLKSNPDKPYYCVHY